MLMANGVSTSGVGRPARTQRRWQIRRCSGTSSEGEEGEAEAEEKACPLEPREASMEVVMWAAVAMAVEGSEGVMLAVPWAVTAVGAQVAPAWKCTAPHQGSIAHGGKRG